MYSMMIKMAWKNAFLRPARTLLVIMMISVSMSMLLGMQGLYDGMVKSMIDKNKRSDSGDISLYAQGYRTEQDIRLIIHDAASVKQRIGRMEGVRSVVSRIRSEGLASTARRSSFAAIYGINLGEEETFGSFSAFLKEGEIRLDKRGIVVGLELAKELKLAIGSKLVFSAQDVSGEINSVAMRVRGIIQTTNISLDTYGIYADAKVVHRFLGTDPKDATQIAVMTDNTALLTRLQQDFPQLEVKSFMQLQPMIQQMQDMMVIFNSITFLIVMSVVFVGILGVMYVSILDRIREFGIVLSIGMHYRYIRFQLLMEALFVGLLGYLGGCVFGGILLIYLRDHGLDLSAFSDALEMWGYEAVITGTIKLSYFTSTLAAIVMASLLSVVIPLMKIKRLNPIEVIKAEK